MVSFFVYDIIFLVLFSLCVGIFLYRNKSNLKREGLMYLYRTKVGMQIIDRVGGKYKRTLKVLSYFAIISGYLLMAFMMYFLIEMVYIYLKNPVLVKAIKIPPLMPLIPYLPSVFKLDFLPPFYFTYWILAIACIAVFHEFAHGILMKRYGVRIKSTGFGFLGPFLAAFVEQDDKQMVKKKKFEQIAILSAGTFTNLVLSILFFILLGLFFMVAYTPAGAMFNTYSQGIVNVSQINSIDGINITINNYTSQEVLKLIQENNLTEDLVLGTNASSINLTKITTFNETYYLPLENLKNQLENNEVEQLVLYEDYPAIRAGLRGTIIEIDNQEIKSYEDLSEVMENYSPGDKIQVETRDGKEILNYELELGENKNIEEREVRGMGMFDENRNLLRKVINALLFFKEPATDYLPKGDSNFIIFIYNLIWWLAVVNISVALVNMLPMGIFDGGRMFMLTIAAITKSDKIGELIFKIATYFILLLFLLLMGSWFFAII